MKRYIGLFLRGMAMGCAEVVPGISGATIALISGIYEELIDTIKGINIRSLQLLLKGEWKQCWLYINGNFIVALFSGMLVSIVVLARVISYLLEQQPVLIWAFFFGLIIASVFLLGALIKRYNIMTFISLLLGIAIAFYLTISPVVNFPHTSGFLFIAGFLALSAWVLPGISGSFILILLGYYQFILAAVKNFQLSDLIIFALGGVISLICLSRILSFLFKRFHDNAYALLTGFVIGALNKIWPWRVTADNPELVNYSHFYGNISPFAYEQLSQQQAHFVYALLLMLVGFAVVLGLRCFSHNKV